MLRLRIAWFTVMATVAIAGSAATARAYDAMAVSDGGTIRAPVRFSEVVHPAKTSISLSAARVTRRTKAYPWMP